MSVQPDSVRAVDWRSVTPDYFRTIGIPLKRGRAFSESDHADAKPVAIIDEQLAARLWPDSDPLGRRFRFPAPIPEIGQPWFEIVGVVGHVRHDGLDRDLRPQVYWNYQQFTQDRAVLVVRSQVESASLAAFIIHEIRSIDPEQPVYDVRTMSEVVDRSISARWLGSLLVGLFAAAALTLTSIGIYGVVSYSVGQRAREFSIRMALGAKRGNLVGFVLRRAVMMTMVGVVIGVAAAFMLTRLMRGLLFNVSTTDWISFSFPIVVMCAVALIAAYVPARRAANTNPMTILR